MGSVRWRFRIGAVLTAVALTAGGCGGTGQPGNPTEVARVAPASTPAQPDLAPVEAPASPTPRRPATPSKPAPSTATPPKANRSPAAAPAARPTRKAGPAPRRKPVADKPPAARKPKPKPGCREKFVGKPASRAQVKAALTQAAGRTYWPVSAPDLTVPLDLVKAVAWQESTWRSNVHACDGGVGLMQVMPDTASYVNNRFEQSYDLNAYTDNAVLGANYLAWLVRYFGDAYFEKRYDLDPAACGSTTELCLLNMVISAYNFGPGAVDDAADNGKPLPNPGYVRSVRKLMTQCECLSY